MQKQKFTDQELMELAIEQMKKSVIEPRTDGKIVPKVGAVLLFPDGRIETAFRGELRDGDHAEFTLIERKLGNENLEECVLYTTLEPCNHRNSPKVPCCKRISYARIKKVFIGIEDKDPKGKGRHHLEAHNIEVKMFDRAFQKIIEFENRDYLKQAIERSETHQEEDLRGAIELPIPNYNISKFSTEALQKFIIASKLDFKTTDESFLEYLADFGAMEWDFEKKYFVPTGFGILLFGKSPRTKFKSAVLKAYVSYGNKKLEPVDFDDPLVLIPDQIEKWLLKVLPLSKDTNEFKRKDIPDYPISVLREAIVNAIVHRDYEIESAKCEIKIDDNKIIVTSPGKPLPAITLEELNTFEAPSLSRNPIITYAFSLMDYVEEKGFGMKTFKSLNKEYGLPIPKYSFKDPFLTLTFPRTPEAVKEVIGKSIINNFSADEMKYFEIFREKQLISKSEFVDYSGLATRTAERYLKEWNENGLLKKIGSGPSTKYKLNEM